MEHTALPLFRNGPVPHISSSVADRVRVMVSWLVEDLHGYLDSTLIQLVGVFMLKMVSNY